MKNSIKFNIFLFTLTLVILLQSCKKMDDDRLADIDGNMYNTVTIGTQEWMAENLKVTKLNNGTAIPLVTDNTAWINLKTPGYCWYNNDGAKYKNQYGALYNWYTVNTTALCPKGWHIPTDADWTSLIHALQGEDYAGGQMKETGISHWNSPNKGATNVSGFSALPGGSRVDEGVFYSITSHGGWWSATEYGPSIAWSIHLFSNVIDTHRYREFKSDGFSVRCVKD